MDCLLQAQDFVRELFKHLDCYSFHSLLLVSKELNQKIDSVGFSQTEMLKHKCKNQLGLTNFKKILGKYSHRWFVFKSPEAKYFYWKRFAAFCSITNSQRRTEQCTDILRVCVTLECAKLISKQREYKVQIASEIIYAMCKTQWMSEKLFGEAIDTVNKYIVKHSDIKSIFKQALDLACDARNYNLMQLICEHCTVYIQEKHLIAMYNRGHYRILETVLSEELCAKSSLDELFDLLIDSHDTEFMSIYTQRERLPTRTFTELYSRGISTEMFCEVLYGGIIIDSDIIMTIAKSDCPAKYLPIAVEHQKGISRRRIFKNKIREAIEYCKINSEAKSGKKSRRMKEKYDYLITCNIAPAIDNNNDIVKYCKFTRQDLDGNVLSEKELRQIVTRLCTEESEEYIKMFEVLISFLEDKALVFPSQETNRFLNLAVKCDNYVVVDMILKSTSFPIVKIGVGIIYSININYPESLMTCLVLLKDGRLDVSKLPNKTRKHWSKNESIKELLEKSI